jgi:hypothetical protein
MARSTRSASTEKSVPSTGSNAVVADEQAVADSAAVKLPACGFAKTGWTFAGWATTAAGAAAFADMASYNTGKADATLFVKWTLPAVYAS